jgi:hypothetical protein
VQPQAHAPQPQAPVRPPPVPQAAPRGPVPTDPRFARAVAAPTLEPQYEDPYVQPGMAAHAGAGQGMTEIEVGAEGDDGTDGYASYGHVVDLSGQVEAPPQPGRPDSLFIKDPLRRSDKAAPPARGVAAPPPARTQQLTVSIPRAELKPGATIRIVLDVKVE